MCIFSLFFIFLKEVERSVQSTRNTSEKLKIQFSFLQSNVVERRAVCKVCCSPCIGIPCPGGLGSPPPLLGVSSFGGSKSFLRASGGKEPPGLLRCRPAHSQPKFPTHSHPCHPTMPTQPMPIPIHHPTSLVFIQGGSCKGALDATCLLKSPPMKLQKRPHRWRLSQEDSLKSKSPNYHATPSEGTPLPEVSQCHQFAHMCPARLTG